MRTQARIVVALAFLASACNFSGLAFRVDDRLTIVEPEDREQVRLPVTVRWRVEDFAVTGPTREPSDDAGYFGVYLDRQPQPPGQPLEWFAKDDETCRAQDGCPDAAYLASRNIYATDQMAFTIETVAQPPSDVKRREFHEVTIALLDGTGRRIGESAYYVVFEVVRDER